MKPHNSLIAARGQIAWILALVVSTGIVIQLERLDIGSRAGGMLSENPLAAPSDPVALLLSDARTRFVASEGGEATDQIRMLLSLSLAALQPGGDVPSLSRDAAAIIASLDAQTSALPLVEETVAVTRRILEMTAD